MKIRNPQNINSSNDGAIEENVNKLWTKKRIFTYMGIITVVILTATFFLTPTNRSIFLSRLNKVVTTEQLTTDYEITVKGTDETQSATGLELEKVNISGSISHDHKNTRMTATTKGLDGLPFEIPYLDIISYDNENYINVNASIEYIARVASLYGFEKVDHTKYNDQFVNIETLIRALAGDDTAKTYKEALDPTQNKDANLQLKINATVTEFLKSRKSDNYSKGRDEDVVLTLEESDIKELLSNIINDIKSHGSYRNDTIKSLESFINSDEFTNQHITVRITMGKNIGDMNIRILTNGTQTGELMLSFTAKTFESVEKPTNIMDKETFEKAIKELQEQILETNLKPTVKDATENSDTKKTENSDTKKDAV